MDELIFLACDVEVAVSWEALEKFPEALGSSSEAHEVELHWLGFLKFMDTNKTASVYLRFAGFYFLFICLLVCF